MIKNCLLKLKEKNFPVPFIGKTIDYLCETFDDDQLLFLLSKGVKLDNQFMLLQYFPGVGFRCLNEDYDYVGRKPICGVIEKTLNNILINS